MSRHTVHDGTFRSTVTAGEPPSLRHVLRERTRQAHERLDRTVERLDLSDPNDYRTFLAIHGAILPRLEERIDAHLADGELDDWAERRRGPALQADMTRIGLTPSASDAELGFVADRHCRAGVLYVLEGSRLGANLLIRAVAGDLNRFPTAFLAHGHGERLWPSFIAWLDGLDIDDDGTENAVRGANLTFDAYLKAAEGAISAREGEKR